MQPRTRRVQRIHLPQPLMARLGSAQVVLVDISLLGARIEHHTPLAAGSHSRISFDWEDESIAADCRIVRSRLERFSIGADGLTIYHSGVELDNPAPEVRDTLKRMIGHFISRALEEQRLNARGVVPDSVVKMPIFRRGQLASNVVDVKEAVGSSMLPTSRVAAETGYVCLSLDRQTWRQKRTHDPTQPAEGFTISATEDGEQIELLCTAYEKSDGDGRKLIQLFAQLSLVEGEGITPGRFDP